MFKDAQGNIDWQALQSGQADVWISIDDVRTVTYADGTQVTLTKPTLWVDNPYDAPDNGAVYDEIEISEDAKSRLFKPDVRFSPRIGMPVFGLGLLEAIKEEDILKYIEKQDFSLTFHQNVNVDFLQFIDAKKIYLIKNVWQLQKKIATQKKAILSNKMKPF